MRNNQSNSKIKLAILCISLSMLFQCPGVDFSAAALARSKPDDISKYPSGTVGKPKVRLRFEGDAGIRIEHYGDAEAGQFSAKLFSINSINLADKSPAQIRKLLEGPIGTTVEIEVVNSQDRLDKYVLTCCSPNDIPDAEYKEYMLSNQAQNPEHDFDVPHFVVPRQADNSSILKITSLL